VEDILEREPEFIATHAFPADPQPALDAPVNLLSAEEYAAGFAASLQAVKQQWL